VGNGSVDQEQTRVKQLLREAKTNASKRVRLNREEGLRLNTTDLHIRHADDHPFSSKKAKILEMNHAKLKYEPMPLIDDAFLK